VAAHRLNFSKASNCQALQPYPIVQEANNRLIRRILLCVNRSLPEIGN
jgi:hypothetical protein